MISDANHTRGRRPESPAQESRGEAARSWLTAIVQSSSDAIIGMTLDGTITSWNPAAKKLYGYTAADAVGRSISLLVPRDQPDEVPVLLARVKRGELVAGYETKKLTKDGRLIDVSLTMSPIQGSAGELIGASTVARDETSASGPTRRCGGTTRWSSLLQGRRPPPTRLRASRRRCAPALRS
jgi:PAS domain S-box-containing protein